MPSRGQLSPAQRFQEASLSVLADSTTSRLFPTEILPAELPEADTIEKHPDWPGVLCVYDEGHNIVGYALRTAPSQEFLHGYQGPTDILIVLDRKANESRPGSVFAKATTTRNTTKGFSITRNGLTSTME